MRDTKLNEYYEKFQTNRKKGTLCIKERLTFIKSQIGEGNIVVELGCRYGDIIKLIYEKNDVTGVDIDRGALEICEKRYGIKTKVANLNETLPFSNGEFERVILTEVLEHLPYIDISLKEIQRILRPGGKLIGSVPNGARLRNKLRFLFTDIIENDPMHLHHFSIRTLRSCLGKYFKNVHIIPISSRFLFLSKHHFANYLLFVCTKGIK